MKKPKYGWKKCYSTCGTFFVIVKLEILGDYIINGYSMFTGDKTNKCRTSKAKVIKIYHPTCDVAVSIHNRRFKYRVGRIVQPFEPFCYSIDACASGIHYFRTKKEAEAYLFT